MGAQVKKTDNVFSEEEKEVNEVDSVEDNDVVNTTINYLAKNFTLEERVARDARISAFVQK